MEDGRGPDGIELDLPGFLPPWHRQGGIPRGQQGGPAAASVPQRAGNGPNEAVFLLIRVTRFQRFFLLASHFQQVPAAATFSNLAATEAGVNL